MWLNLHLEGDHFTMDVSDLVWVEMAHLSVSLWFGAFFLNVSQTVPNAGYVGRLPAQARM